MRSIRPLPELAAWLNDLAGMRVCQERDGAWGASVKVDPLYDGLRSDPRYGEILDRLHLR